MDSRFVLFIWILPRARARGRGQGERKTQQKTSAQFRFHTNAPF
jgi:hypothetical protein